jgi:hypothetical protein
MEKSENNASLSSSSRFIGNTIIISFIFWVVFLAVAFIVNSIALMSIGIFGLLFSFAIACFYWKEYAKLSVDDYNKQKNAYRIIAIPLIIGGLILPLFIGNGKDCEYQSGLWIIGAGVISIGLGWFIGTFRKEK